MKGDDDFKVKANGLVFHLNALNRLEHSRKEESDHPKSDADYKRLKITINCTEQLLFTVGMMLFIAVQYYTARTNER